MGEISQLWSFYLCSGLRWFVFVGVLSLSVMFLKKKGAAVLVFFFLQFVWPRLSKISRLDRQNNHAAIAAAARRLQEPEEL